MELVIRVIVGSNVSLKMKGRNTLLIVRGKPELMKTPFIQPLQPPGRTASLSFRLQRTQPTVPNPKTFKIIPKLLL